MTATDSAVAAPTGKDPAAGLVTLGYLGSITRGSHVSDADTMVRKALGPTFAFLRGKTGLWHRRSIDGLRGILAVGAIHPNDGRFPYRYKQSKTSYARQIGAVSLFDLYSPTEDRAPLQGCDWAQYLIDCPRATVWIPIDPARLDTTKLASSRSIVRTIILARHARRFGRVPLSRRGVVSRPRSARRVRRVRSLPRGSEVGYRACG